MSTIAREFTKEQLQQIIETDHVQCGEASALARIALASLEAEPAIHRWRRVTSEPYGPYPWHYGDFIGFSKPVDGIEDEYFYSAPPAPAPVSDEDKVLAEQARAVVHCLDMCGVPSGDYADNEQLQLWGRVIEYGRHPASVSVPDIATVETTYPDVQTNWHDAKMYAEGWNACRAAMLQGADGSSPVIPDGWVACSERMPEEGSKVIVFRPRASESNDPPVKTASYKGGREYYHGFDCYCEPTHWMPLPAAPQQEVK